MGKLTIKNLRFRSRHGYHDFERVVGNNFEVDVCIKTDLSRAGQTDELNDTLDYTVVCGIVEDIMHGEPVHLVETLLSSIGERIMDDVAEADWVEVAIRKYQPPMETQCDFIEVSDQWQR
jgi:dihydroneopterin aldolase